MRTAIGGNMVLKATRALGTKTFLITGVLLIAFASMFALGWRVWELASFASHRNEGVKIIESMRFQRPPEISDESWDIAIRWTTTAYLNIFFSSDSSSSSSIQSFNAYADDVTKNVGGVVAIENIWNGLSQASPYGEEYVAKFYLEFRSDFEESIEKTEKAKMPEEG